MSREIQDTLSPEEAEAVAAAFISGFDLGRIDFDPLVRERLMANYEKLQAKEFAAAWKESIERLS